MSLTFPQEVAGRTLLEVSSGDEKRRVFSRSHKTYHEVGEITRGALTQEIYNAPEHHHSVHLRDGSAVEYAQRFFDHGEPFLIDLMDKFDEKGISYGYLNSVMGKHVAYRPARRCG